MVSKELFAYIHWRFQQIKGNRKPFGGISVLAVGDFYQLPPLGKAKPLCVYEENEFDLWRDYFEMVNLTEIMRQKDDRAFAELLNRLRVKQKQDLLSNEDRELLTQAVAGIQDCPADRLHIYATNKEVDLHNAQTVATLHKDFVNIDAHNYRKDPRSGCMMIMPEKIQGSKRDLPDNIMAAQGVRIMLIRNLDVEDGIVNGTFGTISHSNILDTENDEKDSASVLKTGRKETGSCSSFLSATVREPEDADRDSSVREEAESQRARSRKKTTRRPQWISPPLKYL
ncbi:ATP-dependent DNA helicase PIF1-like [Larimichthys crocea]|uniref:ATP-dependent DNA helicase PIF1-like n=1 Tax=Larimichthys crocea TaxID=215358 RepID=UPI000F5D7B74|nr:ATP-dependent DNA helicase PIF1-like [Larimichthys crocea]